MLLIAPGAWFVSVFVAPMAILNAGLALREARGVPELGTERRWAIAGLAVSTPVLVLLLIHISLWGLALDSLSPLLR